MRKIQIPTLIFITFAVVIIFYCIGIFSLNSIKKSMVVEMVTWNKEILELLHSRIDYNLNTRSEDADVILEDQYIKVADSLQEIGSRPYVYANVFKYKDGEFSQMVDDNANFSPFDFQDFTDDIMLRFNDRHDVYEVEVENDDGNFIHMSYMWSPDVHQNTSLLMVIGVTEESLSVGLSPMYILSQSVRIAVVSFLLLLILMKHNRCQLENICKDGDKYD